MRGFKFVRNDLHSNEVRTGLHQFYNRKKTGAHYIYITVSLLQVKKESS